jgi:hypothetical protein
MKERKQVGKNKMSFDLRNEKLFMGYPCLEELPLEILTNKGLFRFHELIRKARAFSNISFRFLTQ